MHVQGLDHRKMPSHVSWYACVLYCELKTHANLFYKCNYNALIYTDRKLVVNFNNLMTSRETDMVYCNLCPFEIFSSALRFSKVHLIFLQCQHLISNRLIFLQCQQFSSFVLDIFLFELHSAFDIFVLHGMPYKKSYSYSERDIGADVRVSG